MGGSDDAGSAALEALSGCRRYARWLFELARPFLGSRVVEAGAGLGTMSAFLVERPCASVLLTDADPARVEFLRERFGRREGVSVRAWRLPQPFEPSGPAPDTFVMWNVLEHVDDDVRALEEMRRALAPGGRVVVVAPAGRWLESPLDRRLGHFRRYARRELVRKCAKAGLVPLLERPSNLLGAIGWFVSARFLGAKTLGPVSARLFDLASPVLYRIEVSMPPPIGLSVLVVAERPAWRARPDRPCGAAGPRGA